MKSYSVKSNAKRFARGIAAKYPDYVPLEPALVDPSKYAEASEREWFPAVTRPISSDPHPEEVVATCIIAEVPATALDDYTELRPYQREIIEEIKDSGDRVVIGYARTAPLPGAEASSLLVVDIEGETQFDHEFGPPIVYGSIEEAVADGAFPDPVNPGTVAVSATTEMIADGEVTVDVNMPMVKLSGFSLHVDGEYSGDVSNLTLPKFGGAAVITSENSTFHLTRSGRKMLRGLGGEVVTTTIDPANLAGLAASLPPRQESSPAEIAARRLERRARIEAEKAAGTRTASGDKVKEISKKKKILDLINRRGGATRAELEAATGWQKHTLRGYIAGTLRKAVAPVGVIECEKVMGEDGEKVTRYVFVKHGEVAK